MLLTCRTIRWHISTKQNYHQHQLPNTLPHPILHLPPQITISSHFISLSQYSFTSYQQESWIKVAAKNQGLLALHLWRWSLEANQVTDTIALQNGQREWDLSGHHVWVRLVSMFTEIRLPWLFSRTRTQLYSTILHAEQVSKENTQAITLPLLTNLIERTASQAWLYSSRDFDDLVRDWESLQNHQRSRMMLQITLM